MTHILIHSLEHAFNDSLKILPFLFITYLAMEVLEKFELIEEIMVRVKKPEAPVNGIYDYFGVEIRRKRNE